MGKGKRSVQYMNDTESGCGKEMAVFMNVVWNKCQGEAWCSLNKVNLSNEHFDGMDGVYIIWHGGPTPRVVRVGQGVIRDRFATHRQDEEIQTYADLTLYVS